MISRRLTLGLLAAGTMAPAAFSHTLYPQWVAYRRKHLLIGCHREDNETFHLASRLVDGINHAVPEASARAARAPHPERLASLIGTDQLEIAILTRREALDMRDGAGPFAPYGKIALTRLADFGRYVLVADSSFPIRHGWMVSSAIRDSEILQEIPKSPNLPMHPGAKAQITGTALQDLPRD